MPEISANIKVGLGVIAASAALITGLLGNVLAANISAFFSGTPPKTGKRPVILWVAFFVSASLSVLAGSFATFAPAAPTKPPEQQPKIVVTNVNGRLLQSDAKSLILICRDAVEMANTSDVTTSVVAVGTEINVDGTVLLLDPSANSDTLTAGDVRVAVRKWSAAPAVKNYANIRTLDQFLSVSGTGLPVKVEARNTAVVYVDYALRFAKSMPQSVTATQILRFPDIADIKTDAITCK